MGKNGAEWRFWHWHDVRLGKAGLNYTIIPNIIMKSKILVVTMLALAVAALAGCKKNSETDASVPANSAGAQPTPGTTASNNAAAVPAVPGVTSTNLPAGTKP